MKTEYNFYESSEFYNYKYRSCRNCTLKEDCHALEKNWSFKWLDMGRCGCLKYYGEFNDEKKFKKR